jgi:hypothetical protein
MKSSLAQQFIQLLDVEVQHFVGDVALYILLHLELHVEDLHLLLAEVDQAVQLVL